MLEHSTLLLHGWTHQPNLEGGFWWVRPIADAADQPLGFVRAVGEKPDAWFSWLRRQRLEVFETQDASFLMSLTRSWGILQIWAVTDAEDYLIGRLHAKSIVTNDNRLIGYIERHSVKQGRIVDTGGQLLAQFKMLERGQIELVFAAEQPSNPFLRMLLLSHVLTLDPTAVA